MSGRAPLPGEFDPRRPRGVRALEVSGRPPVQRVDVEEARFLVDAEHVGAFLGLEGTGWLLSGASSGTFADAAGVQRRALEVVFTRPKTAAP